MLILGIESSCDDTAAAVVRAGEGARAEVLSSVALGQDEAHAPYGGVVPEIAARAHAERLDEVVDRAVEQAGVSYGELDRIAATAGPGLVGGVMAGLTVGKGLALALGVPLVPVNHLAGHALSVLLEAEVAFPYLLLLVSGGHSQLLLVEGPDAFRRLGTTIDDAAGEAFDKTAKLLGLSGGGAGVQRAGEGGNARRFRMPRPLLGRPGCDFSFSGMKTAVRQTAEGLAPLSDGDLRDLAASFQAGAADHLVRQTEAAMMMSPARTTRLVAAGGVAANAHLRERLGTLVEKRGWSLTVPSLRYCTDNAAMIALAGAYVDPSEDALGTAPRPRWPLDEDVAGIGGGRKGPKA
ncbi:tRNA (adenosine(37)-N6)-threonylcarbamoyltransferase complex transferase subunit TsaD [Parvularcula dongshanensis]|uniref:tRNA N6-adenosine threonylcarbamoyltransferase n=1 Tax=Parvularcula dongshanensis TaxID=1173995 RepID=A0A840I064_9PROT|nr:tRNA (adenosine(37)-N6)-threonylcarbamoyltransferase complex transferase subunit TsaD [Parvularcula dongshanensis]MBB4657558.1 N6-L-threonylcarbamoyladenine synthase [Parvularcula dongshanensis]